MGGLYQRGLILLGGGIVCHGCSLGRENRREGGKHEASYIPEGGRGFEVTKRFIFI